jgi:hypothetical protein
MISLQESASHGNRYGLSAIPSTEFRQNAFDSSLHCLLRDIQGLAMTFPAINFLDVTELPSTTCSAIGHPHFRFLILRLWSSTRLTLATNVS